MPAAIRHAYAQPTAAIACDANRDMARRRPSGRWVAHAPRLISIPRPMEKEGTREERAVHMRRPIRCSIANTAASPTLIGAPAHACLHGVAWGPRPRPPARLPIIPDRRIPGPALLGPIAAVRPSGPYYCRRIFLPKRSRHPSRPT